MKQVLTPLTALTLALTGFSMQQAGWFSAASAAHVEVRRTSSAALTSEAAFRHRTCQPMHWRSMLMNK